MSSPRRVPPGGCALPFALFALAFWAGLFAFVFWSLP